jgi:hypothetical protein
MTTSRIAALALIALATCSTRPVAQSVGVEKQLAELDKQLQQAIVDGRADLVAHYYAPDFTFTHGEDTKDNQAVWVQRAKQTPRHYLRRQVSGQVIEIHGDVGLVFGRLDTRGFPPSADPLTSTPRCLAFEYVHTYAKRNGEWLFVSHRTTRVIEDSHPCP